MRTPQDAILRTESPRGFRLIEIVNSQPLEVRRLAIGTLERAQGSHPEIIQMAKDDPFTFIRDVRETMERTAALSPRGEPPAQVFDQEILDVIDDFISTSPARHEPPPQGRAQAIVNSAGPQSREVGDRASNFLRSARDDLRRSFAVENPLTHQSSLPETRRWGVLNAQSNEPPEVDSPAESTPRSLIEMLDLLESESPEVQSLAMNILESAMHDLSPDSAWERARANPRGFLSEMRTMAARNAQPNETRRGITNASERRTTEPLPRSSRTPVGIDPDIFRTLPDHIRTELLALLPLAPATSPQSPQGTPAGGDQPAPQGTRPATETTSASSSSQPAPAEGRVEEVLWPRINEWLQSRTGPCPIVLCVWCQEEVVIPDGNLQPDNGEREPSFQLPCSHIVGERCLHNSRELFGVTRCPYCRADIGDVYR